MKLFAISDIHLSHKINRESVEAFAARPPRDYSADWLILAGDVGERAEHLSFALHTLSRVFAKIIWVPGNHDLWCPPDATDRTRGEARYRELVTICHAFNALTPEDPFVEWPHSDIVIVPMFLLFDYSFRPPDVSRADATAWARDTGVGATDEVFLDPTPWPSRDAWCHARCDDTEARLRELPDHARTILINHWPLRYDLARPPRVPRFSLWSGTMRTEDWGQRFRARAVISGHLHLRTTMARFGVRYDEVSLGYPRDWKQERGFAYYLREVLPDPDDRFVPPRDPFLY